MMRRYLEIKEQYKDAILLFRLGDFMKCFRRRRNRVRFSEPDAYRARLRA